MSVLANLEHADALVRMVGQARVSEVKVHGGGVDLFASSHDAGERILGQRDGLALTYELDAHDFYRFTFRDVTVGLYVPHAPKEPA